MLFEINKVLLLLNIQYFTFKEANKVLKSLPVVDVGPAHLLYVNQREFAVAAPGSGKHYQTV